MRIELRANPGAVEPCLRHQQNTVQHIGKLARGSVVGGFALCNHAQVIALRLAGDSDPLEVIEKRGQLRRLEPARSAGGPCGSGSSVLAEHGEDRRACKASETFTPFQGVLADGGVGEKRAEICSSGESDAVVA